MVMISSQMNKSSNQTLDVTVPAPLAMYVIGFISLLQATAVIAANVIIALSIMFHKHLRSKEFLLFFGLAISDGLIGINSFHRNINALFLTSNTVNLWQCISGLEAPMFWLSSQAQAYMLIVLSLDRFIAVTFFFFYKEYTHRYVVKVFTVVAMLCLLFMLLATISIYGNPLAHAMFVPILACAPALLSVSPKLLMSYHFFLTNAGGYASVVLYAAVLVGYRLRMPQFHGNVQNQQQVKKQKKMTAVVGFIALNTVLFNCIPATISILLSSKSTEKPAQLLIQLLLVVKTNGSLANVFVYAWRQKELRQGMKRLVCCSCNVAIAPHTSYDMANLGTAGFSGQPAPGSRHSIQDRKVNQKPTLSVLGAAV